ncbi:MAG: WD40 repeat domain-containing protein [Anaerolineae bacterium]|nr:WD40 repeat domain-containing protein [Anaerolineae bacterium]
MSRYTFILCAILFIIMPLSAQTDEPDYPPVTLDTIRDLRSVIRVEFDAYPDIVSGWFVVSPDGRYVAVRVGLDRMMIFEEGVLIDEFQANNPRLENANIIDAVFNPSGDTLSVLDERGMVTFRDVVRQAEASMNFDLADDIIPQALWLRDGQAWIEALSLSDNQPVVGHMASETPPTYQPYAPADDPNALVRIGRVLPPYVVTSSPEGEVKLWDLEMGDVISTGDVGDMPAVFGQISPNGQFLVWRDPMSENVNLLNFETGENVVVAELNGVYFQAFYASDDGTVVWAVDEDFEPRVVAWIVATGERIDLGEFRECSRVPDMIRMSHDMTTLVIGCDTGLDIWRVAPESE